MGEKQEMNRTILFRGTSTRHYFELKNIGVKCTCDLKHLISGVQLKPEKETLAEKIKNKLHYEKEVKLY
jgi:hypothetical protein